MQPSYHSLSRIIRTSEARHAARIKTWVVFPSAFMECPSSCKKDRCTKQSFGCLIRLLPEAQEGWNILDYIAVIILLRPQQSACKGMARIDQQSILEVSSRRPKHLNSSSPYAECSATGLKQAWRQSSRLVEGFKTEQPFFLGFSEF
jgi:hypothetical protein